MANKSLQTKPEQTQEKQPGREKKMLPEPISIPKEQDRQLAGKVVLITGGDSGIGKAIALLFALHGAAIAFTYTQNEEEDANETERMIRSYGAEVIALKGDLRKVSFCNKIVADTVKRFGTIDILINNAAVQYPQESLTHIEDSQLIETFETNFYAYVRVTRAALFHMHSGSAIINTTSVTAYEGHPQLIDYSATKGAIVSFTRALARNIADKKIRVNAVAPGPVWTPLIPSSFDGKKVKKFGSNTPMKRPGEPNEIAPAYLFLASADGSYITGQTIHVNGGGFTTS